jgi:hypothetical protein
METQQSPNQNWAFGKLIFFIKKIRSQLFASLFVILHLFKILHPRKPSSKFPIVCDALQLDNMIFPLV